MTLDDKKIPTEAPGLQPVCGVLIVGHRSNRLPQKSEDQKLVWATLSTALKAIKVGSTEIMEPYMRSAIAHQQWAVFEGAPAVRVVIGEAEGTDEKAAQITSELGLPTLVITPGGEARSATAARISLAAARYANGVFDDRDIELANEISVAFADIVVAVWDGEPAAGLLGGTVQVIQRALVARKPVLWIRAREAMDGGKIGEVHISQLDHIDEPTRVAIADPNFKLDDIKSCFSLVPEGDVYSRITEVLRRDLTPWALTENNNAPKKTLLRRVGGAWKSLLSRPHEPHQELKYYFSHKYRYSWRARRAGCIERFFGTLLQPWSSKLWKGVPSAPDAWIEKPDKAFDEALPEQGRAVLGRLKKRLLLSDRWSNVFAGQHRSAVWLLYLAASIAVFAAVSGAVMDWPGEGSSFWPWTEFAVIVLILVILARRIFSNTHSQWLWHRALSEQLRYQMIVYPLLGWTKPFVAPLWSVEINHHVGRNHSSHTDHPSKKVKVELSSSHVWLLRRELIGNGPIQGITEAAQRNVLKVVEAQRDWHEKDAEKAEHQHHILEHVSVMSFVLTFAAVISHFIWHWEWLVIATTTLPALGAAIHGITTSFDYKRRAAQSENTAKLLSVYAKSLSAEKGDDAKYFSRVRNISMGSANLLSDGNGEWQRSTQQLDLTLPA